MSLDVFSFAVGFFLGIVFMWLAIVFTAAWELWERRR